MKNEKKMECRGVALQIREITLEKAVKTFVSGTAFVTSLREEVEHVAM